MNVSLAIALYKPDKETSKIIILIVPNSTEEKGGESKNKVQPMKNILIIHKYWKEYREENKDLSPIEWSKLQPYNIHSVSSGL